MADDSSLIQTQLHQQHVSAGARMGDLDGWSMPLDYGHGEEELQTVKSRAGIFDVSNLGRIRLRGYGAIDLLERICTTDVARQEDDTTVVTAVCNEAGKIIDVCILARLEDDWLLTTSPSRRQRVLEHIEANAGDFDAKVTDQTQKTAMLRVIGPKAAELLDTFLPEKVSNLPRGSAKTGTFMIARYIAMRTGSTKLWSVEITFPAMLAGQAWRFITEKAGDNIIKPAGVTTAEALRVEAGLPRYGAELDETTDPITAGLKRVVDFNHEFIGKESLMKIGK